MSSSSCTWPQPEDALRRRTQLRDHWAERAVITMAASLAELEEIPDRHLRRLLRGVPDGVVPRLGESFHVVLCRELASVGRCKDTELLGQNMTGMPVVGDILRSGRWPEIPLNDRPDQEWSEHKLKERAWEIRADVLTGLKRRPVGPEMEDLASCS